MSKPVLVLILLVCLAGPSLFAQSSDDILLADVPITYGDAAFRQRVYDRTEGKRSPVGLVLSGGSARAFAHIGVLKSLEEQGIVPDFIVSNSMGSIVGMLYAAGMSADQILESVSTVSLETLFDVTLPLQGGLLDSSRFISKIASILGPGLQLEHLPIPIIVITEDLVTKRQVHLAEGDFYTILQASYALPVYFPPVEFRGHLLLDGGVTNLAPINLAYEFADSVIVSTTFYDVDTLNLKDPLTLLNVSIDIGKRRRGVEELKQHLDDIVWIRCDVEDFSFMQFSAVQTLFEKGYASAELQKENLKKLPQTLSVSSLDAIRSTYAASLLESTKAYSLYNHITLVSPTNLVGVGFNSDRTEKDASQLKDDNTLGLEYIYRNKDLGVAINAGMATYLYTNDRFSFQPSLRTQVSYHFLDHFETSFQASFIYDLKLNAPVINLGAKLEGKVMVFDDKLSLSVSQAFEHNSNPNNSTVLDYWDGQRYLLSASLGAAFEPWTTETWMFNQAGLAFDLQTLGDYQSARLFLGGRGDYEMESQSIDLFATAHASLRFALDGKGEVPILLTDGFRTNNSAIRSQGHTLSVSANPANHLVAFNFDIGYRPKSFEPTMAELLLFRNVSVALYTDLLWYQMSWQPALSIGLELHAEVSLLGIRTLPLTVYAGYDQSVNAMVWGLMFNLAY